MMEAMISSKQHMLALALAVASFATAAPVAAQGHERARALFEAGRVAVSEGDYESALRYFTEAYELSERPRLLFNMANAADRLRDDERALALYRRYLEAVPDAENAEYVNARIDALLTAQQNQTEPPEPDPEPEPEPEPMQPPPEPEPEPSSSEPPVAGIAVTAAGGAFAVTGAILLGVGAAERGNVDGAPVGSMWSEYEGSHETANTLTPIGAALLGVGVAAAAVGIVLIVVGGGDDEESVALVPTGNGLLVRGRF